LVAARAEGGGSRPALAVERLSVTGRLRDALKHTYADGTTHFPFHSLDLLARLAARVGSVSPAITHLRSEQATAPAHRARHTRTRKAPPGKPIGRDPRSEAGVPA
jgi:hypothetical protein